MAEPVLSVKTPPTFRGVGDVSVSSTAPKTASVVTGEIIETCVSR